jgi:hypothetical protein
MPDVAWGESVRGVRFGLRHPARDLEAGGTVVVELVVENGSPAPISVFGFDPRYPRALRISPPKSDRPWIRISFGDVNVLHGPDAFLRVSPGESKSVGLDLSFAFDRRGVGRWDAAFVYEPVRAAGGQKPWTPAQGEEARTGICALDIVPAQSLRDAGIDADVEAGLDSLLFGDREAFVERLRHLGDGGLLFAARRVARILSPGVESMLGWRALDALSIFGAEGVRAAERAREDLPHAASALDFAVDWLGSKTGHAVPERDLPFVTKLERLVLEPESRGNMILSWTACDSPVHGLRQCQIFGNGGRIVTARAPSDPVPRTRRDALSPMQVKTLLDALRMNAIWLLRPLRRDGLPDEPRPALEAQLDLGEPFIRRIAMWNGEWREGPAASLASLLDRLATP